MYGSARCKGITNEIASDELSLREPFPNVREPRPTNAASRLSEPVTCEAIVGVDKRASRERGMQRPDYVNA
jgi:hypothetical protein